MQAALVFDLAALEFEPASVVFFFCIDLDDDISLGHAPCEFRISHAREHQVFVQPEHYHVKGNKFFNHFFHRIAPLDIIQDFPVPNASVSIAGACADCLRLIKTYIQNQQSRLWSFQMLP